jgi:hypothetical protein
LEGSLCRPHASLGTVPLTALPLGLCVLLADFGACAPPLLPFGRLPAPQQLQTLRLPAVPLVPALRHKRAVAPLTMALPRRKASWTCQRPAAARRLGVSHGRCLLPLGPPEGL